MNRIRVLFCPPGQKPQLIFIDNSIEAIELLLEGPVGTKNIDDDGLCILFNDHGHKKALDLNRVVQDDPIFGSCIFCRKSNGQYLSLKEDEQTELESMLG